MAAVARSWASTATSFSSSLQTTGPWRFCAHTRRTLFWRHGRVRWQVRGVLAGKLAHPPSRPGAYTQHACRHACRHACSHARTHARLNDAALRYHCAYPPGVWTENAASTRKRAGSELTRDEHTVCGCRLVHDQHRRKRHALHVPVLFSPKPELNPKP